MSISRAKRANVAKWGNSLAVRLPQAFAAELGGLGSTVRFAMIGHSEVSRTTEGFGEDEQADIAQVSAEAVIGKWGNSLAVRLPAAITSELGLKEGDSVTLAADGTQVVVARQRTRAEALESFLGLHELVTGSIRYSRDDLLLRGPDVGE